MILSITYQNIQMKKNSSKIFIDLDRSKRYNECNKVHISL